MPVDPTASEKLIHVNFLTCRAKLDHNTWLRNSSSRRFGEEGCGLVLHRGAGPKILKFPSDIAVGENPKKRKG